MILMSFIGCSSSGTNTISETKNTATKEIINKQAEEQKKIQAIDAQLADVKLTNDKKKNLLFEKSDLLIKLEKYEDALLTLKELGGMSDAYKVKGYYYNIGYSNYKLGKYSDAVVAMNHSKVFDKGYKQNERYRIIARSYFQMEKYGPGIKALASAAKDDSFNKDLEYYEMVSRGFKEINLCKRSIKIASEGLVKFPENSSLLKIKKECEVGVQ